MSPLVGSSESRASRCSMLCTSLRIDFNARSGFSGSSLQSPIDKRTVDVIKTASQLNEPMKQRFLTTSLCLTTATAVFFLAGSRGQKGGPPPARGGGTKNTQIY